MPVVLVKKTMKFSTSKTELQQALQKLNKATPTRSTLPILTCVFIETKEEATTLKTTDLELTIEVEIPSSTERPGTTALPLKTLLDITNELPETRITISVNENNKATIKTDLGEYDQMARPAEEYPKTPEQKEAKELVLPGNILKQIINSCVFAVSQDDLKPALTGVLLQISQKGITAVATDGHRLVRHIRSDYKSETDLKEVIVPKKFLAYLSGQISDKEIVFLFGKGHLSAKIERDVVITRLINESFPNYESVIPTNNTKQLKTNKEDFLGAIKRVSIFSNKATHQVALSLSDNSCKITTEDPEKSSKAQENIIGVLQGDPIVIGYNAEYLKDIVSHVPGDELVIELNTPISAALFSSLQTQDSVETTMLLMPIRLND